MGAFKLDENLPPEFRIPLQQAGHDVTTATEQALGGRPDHDVAEACRREGRCLITADLDFAQIVAYAPEEFSGIIVLRHPRPTLAGLQRIVHQVASTAVREPLVGRLWIVEPGHIRIHEPDR